MRINTINGPVEAAFIEADGRDALFLLANGKHTRKFLTDKEMESLGLPFDKPSPEESPSGPPGAFTAKVKGGAARKGRLTAPDTGDPAAQAQAGRPAGPCPPPPPDLFK